MDNVMHSLTISERKTLTASGIEGVRDFSPSRITLACGGGRIIVGGADMKITAFSKQTGDFSVAGRILSVRYVPAIGGIGRRLLR